MLEAAAVIVLAGMLAWVYMALRVAIEYDVQATFKRMLGGGGNGTSDGTDADDEHA